jgi:hypothetical protein
MTDDLEVEAETTYIPKLHLGAQGLTQQRSESQQAAGRESCRRHQEARGSPLWAATRELFPQETWLCSFFFCCCCVEAMVKGGVLESSKVDKRKSS